jgi:hypothetical protein
MKTAKEILQSQMIHDSLPFSKKTFDKDYEFVLEAMEEYADERTVEYKEEISILKEKINNLMIENSFREFQG